MKGKGFATRILIALCLVLCIGACLTTEAFAQEASNVPTYNILLLLDKSGSMNITDEGHLSQDAAKMFVDSLYMEHLRDENRNSANVRVGVMPFSNTVASLNPVEINTIDDLNRVTEFIDSIQYDALGTGGTDIGLVLSKAMDRVAGTEEPGDQNVVILFSDGYTEVGNEAAMECSEQMLDESIAYARQNGCEIYAIGLNHNQSIPEEGKLRIWEIANNTQTRRGVAYPDLQDGAGGTRVNYQITDSREEIQEFYMNLFGVLFKGEDPQEATRNYADGWSNYELRIDSDEYSWVKVYILSNEAIGDFEVLNPNGLRMNEDSSLLTRRGKGYVLLTISDPAAGLWNIRAEGDVTYNVRYLTIKGVHMELDAQQTQGPHGTVTVRGFYEQEPLDETFYSGLSLTCVLVPATGGSPVPVTLTYDPDQNLMQGELEFAAPGEYRVLVDAVSEGHPLHAETEITASLSATIREKSLQFNLGSGEERSYDLSSMVTSEWNGYSITIDGVKSTGNAVTATSDGSVLTLKGKQKGESDLEIRYSDQFGNHFKISGKATVARNPVVYWGIGGAAVLAALGGILLWKRRTDYVSGAFEVKCSSGGRNTGPEEREAVAIHRSSFSVYQLVSGLLRNNIKEQGSSSAAYMLEKVNQHRQELSGKDMNIHIYTRRNRRRSRGRSRRNNDRTYRLGPENKLLNMSTVFSSEDADAPLEIQISFLPRRDETENDMDLGY